MPPSHSVNRRRFMLTAAGAAAWASSAKLAHAIGQSPGDTIRLAIIGFGTQGLTDANAALRVPNVQVVAAASCYDGHLERARELLGDDSLRTRDYRRILDRKDIDAVVVATPDHWHTRVILDALDAGKDVYCEKPITHTADEGAVLVRAVQKSKRILQVGSQHTSSPHIIEAKQLIKDGVLGQVTQLEGSWNTNNEISSWLAPAPPDASETTIDWPRFQGTAPKRPFDPDRHFQWRIFQEYGEGLAGDVLVHIITTLHFVLDLDVPTVGNAVGGRFVWKGKRNVYDTITGSWEYPEGMISVLGATQNTAYGGTQIRIMGTKATMVLTFTDYKIYDDDSPPNWRYTTNVWPKAARESYWQSKGLPIETPPPQIGSNPQRVPVVSRQWQPPTPPVRQPWHMLHFVDCLRARRTPVQDVVMGTNAALTSHMANLAYYGKQTVRFDRATRKLTARVPRNG